MTVGDAAKEEGVGRNLVRRNIVALAALHKRELGTAAMRLLQMDGGRGQGWQADDSDAGPVVAAKKEAPSEDGAL